MRIVVGRKMRKTERLCRVSSFSAKFAHESNVFLHFPKWCKNNKIDYFTHEIWAETKKEKKNKT